MGAAPARRGTAADWRSQRANGVGRWSTGVALSVAWVWTCVLSAPPPQRRA